MRAQSLQKSKAYAHEMLIWAKKGGSSDMAQGSKLDFHFGPTRLSSLGPRQIVSLAHEKLISPH